VPAGISLMDFFSASGLAETGGDDLNSASYSVV